MRIGIVVVHVGRRLGSLVQLSAVQSCDLPEIKAPCRLLRRAALKGIRVFLTRAGARGLGITTRKAAEGTRANFCAGLCWSDHFLSLLFRRIPVFLDYFRTSVPQSSGQVRQARLF
jgi:hypothetical protein